MRAVKKYFDQFFEVGAISAFSGMLIAVLAEIFFRYVFSMSLPWAEELARFLGIWTVFLGSAVLVKKRLHLSIDFLFREMSGTQKLAIALSIDILTLVFCIGLTYGTFIMLKKSSNIMAPALQVSTSWFYLALLMGGIGMMVYLLAGIISTISNLLRD
ncbi:MAG TPA: TRAP transporter small permease [Desulfobacteraceae bacterium]|nr:TRAP transporter small permease [Desulfobacteraceae bacterium]